MPEDSAPRSPASSLRAPEAAGGFGAAACSRRRVAAQEWGACFAAHPPLLRCASAPCAAPTAFTALTALTALPPLPPYRPQHPLNPRQLLRREPQLPRRADAVLELAHLAGADDGGGDDGIPQGPGEGHLGQG